MNRKGARDKAQDGTLLETLAPLTTAANKFLAPIHVRMPVILHTQEYRL